LHKFYTSERPDRNPLKREKDVKQGFAVAHLVARYLPQFPFSEDFLQGIDSTLLDCFERHLADTLPSISGSESPM
jgi:hypothetical protein